MTWISRLNKYIRIYGYKFPKEDHVLLIKLLLGFITSEGNTFTSLISFELLYDIFNPPPVLTVWFLALCVNYN